jgi:hypothetical protein
MPARQPGARSFSPRKGVARAPRPHPWRPLLLSMQAAIGPRSHYATGDLVSQAPAVVQALATGQRAAIAIGITRDLAAAA